MWDMQQDNEQAWSRVWETLFPRSKQRIPVGMTPADVVFHDGRLRLLHYRNPQPVRYREPVLVCFALVNRPYILDLHPRRSVVQQLLAGGLDVYLIDWGIPDDDGRQQTIDDYVNQKLHRVVEWTSARHAHQPIHLLGYCMGGTLATLYTCLHPQRIKNLILMATPIDFEQGDSLLHRWTDPAYFDVDAFVDAFGNCPGPFLQACFRMMKPVQNFHQKYLQLWNHREDQQYVEHFAAMEQWSEESIPVAGETFRQFVRWLYQENRLVRNQLELAGHPVSLRQITCPLLLLTADADHLVPPPSSLALCGAVGSSDVQTQSLPVGHVGLAVSSRAHSEFWPRAVRWLTDRSTPVAER
jgi:polyhydroxyalkanoate synthase